MSQDPSENQNAPADSQNAPTSPAQQPLNIPAIQGPEAAQPGEFFEPAPHVPNTTEFFNSLWKGASQGTIPQLMSALQVTRLNHDPTSPKLTQDNITNLQKDRPGLTLKKGMSQSAATYLTNKYDMARTANIVSNDANPDFAGKLSALSGNIIGQATDVVGDAAAAFAPELVGVDKYASLAGMMDRSVDALKGGISAGASFGLPSTAAQAINDEAKGSPDSFNGAAALLSIGENAALGVPLHGAGRLIADKLEGNTSPVEKAINPEGNEQVKDIINNHAPIDANTSNLAIQTAISQSLQGKDVDVGPIIQQGVAKQDALLNSDIEKTGVPKQKVIQAINESQVDLNKRLATSNAENALEMTDSKLNQAALEKDDLPEDLKQTLSEVPVKDNGQGLPIMKEQMGRELDELNQRHQTIGLDPDESDYFNELQDTHSALSDWHQRTQNLATITDPEIRMAKSQVADLRDQISEIKKQPNLSVNDHIDRISAIESKIDELQPLVSKVKMKDVVPTENLKSTDIENNALHQMSASHDLLRESLTNPKEAITPAELDQYLKNMHKSSGNFTRTPDEKPFVEEPESKSESQLLSDTYPASRQKELLDTTKLDDDLNLQQKEIDKEEKNLKTRKKVIKAAINCMLRNA